MSTRLQLEKLSNTRDLGGIRTKSGKTIRKNVLLRSGQLFFASEADIESLQKYNVTQVIDFRTAEEQQEKPDPVIPGAEYMHLPAIADAAIGISREKETNQRSIDMVIEKVAENPAFAVTYMKKLYAEMMENPFVQKQYASFLRLLACNDTGATLWHCTAGKDRAGMATVFVLEILGVDYDVIKEDYLATNTYLMPDIDALIHMLSRKMPLEGKEEAVRTFFSAQEEFLEAAYASAAAQYGDMQQFLEKALHVDAELKAKMRQKFLQ
ncbi:MAG: tyrosine-protein phosphatase [Clostridia bacterium]|nr:tyrosine-protein phosphatase [Clostridia bacterium]